MKRNGFVPSSCMVRGTSELPPVSSLTSGFRFDVAGDSLAYLWQRENTLRLPFQLSFAKEFDVVVLGENSLDYLIDAPRYPDFDTKLHFNEHTQAAGGQIASAMFGLQRLGLRTAYAGRFGADAGGRFGIESLARRS